MIFVRQGAARSSRKKSLTPHFPVKLLGVQVDCRQRAKLRSEKSRRSFALIGSLPVDKISIELWTRTAIS